MILFSIIDYQLMKAIKSLNILSIILEKSGELINYIFLSKFKLSNSHNYI
jgi:hypothetical protein